MKKVASFVTALLMIGFFAFHDGYEYTKRREQSDSILSEARQMTQLLIGYEDNAPLYDKLINRFHDTAFRSSYRRISRRGSYRLDEARYFSKLGSLMRQSSEAKTHPELAAAINRDWSFKGWMSLRNRARRSANG